MIDFEREVEGERCKDRRRAERGRERERETTQSLESFQPAQRLGAVFCL
jgi:hypothetical protein